MNRRELLKFSLLSPLLGLLKKKERNPPTFTVGDSEPVEFELTTGTSSDTTVMEFPYRFNTPPEEGVWTDEQKHPLGTRRTDSAGRVWTYVKWQGQ